MEYYWEKIKKNRLSDDVARRLRQMIRDGILLQGDRIIEEELAKKFGTSKSPIREGISQLMQEGLVYKSPRRGVYIREFNKVDFWEIQTLRISLEGLAVELGIENYSEEWVKLLEESLKNIEKSKDKKEIDKLHMDFHANLCNNAGHIRLQEVLFNLRTQINTYLPLLNIFSNTGYDVANEHSQIIEAVKNRDKRKTKKALEDHIKADFGRLDKIFVPREKDN